MLQPRRRPLCGEVLGQIRTAEHGREAIYSFPHRRHGPARRDWCDLIVTDPASVALALAGAGGAIQASPDTDRRWPT